MEESEDIEERLEALRERFALEREERLFRRLVDSEEVRLSTEEGESGSDEELGVKVRRHCTHRVPMQAFTVSSGTSVPEPVYVCPRCWEHVYDWQQLTYRGDVATAEIPLASALELRHGVWTCLEAGRWAASMALPHCKNGPCGTTASPPRCRRVPLRMDEEEGVGLDLSVVPRGLLIEEIFKTPGQHRLQPKDLIVAIDGRPLDSKSCGGSEALQEAGFCARLRHGALVDVLLREGETEIEVEASELAGKPLRSRCVREAGSTSQDVHFRCIECNAGFESWSTCLQHIRDTGHLSREGGPKGFTIAEMIKLCAEAAREMPLTQRLDVGLRVAYLPESCGLLGAGLKLRPENEGIRIQAILQKPGQPELLEDDLLLACDGVPLGVAGVGGRQGKKQERVLLQHFRHGASLLIQRDFSRTAASDVVGSEEKRRLANDRERLRRGELAELERARAQCPRCLEPLDRALEDLVALSQAGCLPSIGKSRMRAALRGFGIAYSLLPSSAIPAARFGSVSEATASGCRRLFARFEVQWRGGGLGAAGPFVTGPALFEPGREFQWLGGDERPEELWEALLERRMVPGSLGPPPMAPPGKQRPLLSLRLKRALRPLLQRVTNSGDRTLGDGGGPVVAVAAHAERLALLQLCRALTQRSRKKVALDGELSLHLEIKELPCLSCVAIFHQIIRVFPGLRIRLHAGSRKY